MISATSVIENGRRRNRLAPVSSGLLSLGSATVKEAKQFRKQAKRAERVALAVSDAEISKTFLNLAKAYRSQADALKQKEKLKAKQKAGKRGARR
jgi:hypothetical protein